MGATRLMNRSVKWPFWLLMVAWVCANVPQTALFATFAWLADARHFNHQQRVTLEVARLLGGEAGADPIELSSAEGERTPPPLVTTDGAAKKIVLALEPTSTALASAWVSGSEASGGVGAPEARREPPPVEPPRTLV